MQFVTKATTTISEGAARVVDAVGTATTTLQTELASGITDASTAITTVSGVDCSQTWRAMVLYITLRCVCTQPLGWPVVPEV